MSEMEHDHGGGEQQGSRFAKAHGVLMLSLAGAALIWLLSGVYQVKTGQVAITERLGQYVTNGSGTVTELGPGLRYHLPWPIDRVSLISTQQIYTMPVTAFNSSPVEYEDFKLLLKRLGNSEDQINALFDPYLITGDKSVAHVELGMQFTINDPVAWLTSVSHDYHMGYDPTAADDMRNRLFQQLAQRAIVAQVARMDLQKVVGEGRAEMVRGIQDGLQHAMEVPDPDHAAAHASTSLGVQVQSVAISDARVPDAVKGAYDNLNTQRARADTARLGAAAQADAYKAQAQGEKDTLITNANAYKHSVTETAQGEADRFALVLEQYEQAPALTRASLYKDAAQAVAEGAKRIIYAKPGEPVVLTVDPPGYDAAQVQAQQGH